MANEHGGDLGDEAVTRLSEEDHKLVAALRAGDETAFCTLVDRFYSSMLSVARNYVSTREAAEDVVQETFLAVVEGIDRFEGRSSLKTWMYRILANQSKTRGKRDARSRPFSSLTADDDHAPTVDPSRFLGPDHRHAGFWASPPAENFPEERALAKEAHGVLQQVIAQLPEAQRLVLTLRDVQGFSSAEVCELLEISEGNQRVLLHRARAKARAALERHGERHAEATR